MIRKKAEYAVRKEALPDALAAIRAFVDEVARKEGGTASYRAYQHVEDETKFTHFMEFRTPAAEQYHRQTPWVKKFVATLYPLCTVEPAFTDLKPVE